MTKEEIVKLASETATATVLKITSKESKTKSRYDKRLRNTKLLLENYQLLKDHCERAIYDKMDLIPADNINVIDVLDSLEDQDDYILSIKRSVTRTKIILAHVDEMIKIYRIWCEESDKPENMRRYRILRGTYFENQKAVDICTMEGIEQRTFYRDCHDIHERLSALIFGIDGLTKMAKR